MWGIEGVTVSRDTQWGENGYIRMEGGINAQEGLWGIAMDAWYATSRLKSCTICDIV